MFEKGLSSALFSDYCSGLLEMIMIFIQEKKMIFMFIRRIKNCFKNLFIGFIVWFRLIGNDYDFSSIKQENDMYVY